MAYNIQNVVPPIIPDPGCDVPQWQMDEVRKRIDKYKKDPELLIDEDTFFAILNED